MSTYIIPDIHGCVKTLRSLIECRLCVTTADNLYFLGDYIDRGPDSAGVIDYLIGLQESGLRINCLLGNHEQLLLNSGLSKADLTLWMQNSGMETLKSYGIRTKYKLNILRSIPPKHLEFYKSLTTYFILNNKYILVHGGLNFNSEDLFVDKQEILWCRTDEVPVSFMPDYTIICGHNPKPIDFIIRDVHLRKKRMIRLDAGCVYKGLLPGTGFLTALNIDKWELDFVECID